MTTRCSRHAEAEELWRVQERQRREIGRLPITPPESPPGLNSAERQGGFARDTLSNSYV